MSVSHLQPLFPTGREALSGAVKAFVCRIAPLELKETPAQDHSMICLRKTSLMNYITISKVHYCFLVCFRSKQRKSQPLASLFPHILLQYTNSPVTGMAYGLCASQDIAAGDVILHEQVLCVCFLPTGSFTHLIKKGVGDVFC